MQNAKGLLQTFWLRICILIRSPRCFICLLKFKGHCAGIIQQVLLIQSQNYQPRGSQSPEGLLGNVEDSVLTDGNIYSTWTLPWISLSSEAMSHFHVILVFRQLLDFTEAPTGPHHYGWAMNKTGPVSPSWPRPPDLLPRGGCFCVCNQWFHCSHPPSLLL